MVASTVFVQTHRHSHRLSRRVDTVLTVTTRLIAELDAGN